MKRKPQAPPAEASSPSSSTPPAKKKKTGSQRMYALGKKPILVWATPDELALLREAAKLTRRPVATFVLYWALEMAYEHLELDGPDTSSQKKDPTP